MRINQAPIAATLIAALCTIAGPALLEASVPSPLASSRVLKTTDPFTTVPQLDLPSLTRQLKAIEERRTAASECAALCELAAGIEAHPIGRTVSVTPIGTQDAWGNYRFTSELAPSHNRFGFTGHYWDKEASLYYAKARYYDPFTARFTQADSFLGTIDDPPSLHRYFYANDNPTLYTDPTGYAVVSATETEALRGMLGRSKFSSPSVMGKPGQLSPSFSMSPEQQATLAAQVEALTNAGLSHSAAITIEEGDFEKGSLNADKVLSQFYARTGRFATEMDGFDAALKARIAGAKAGDTVGVSDLYSDAYNYSSDRATEEARTATHWWDPTGVKYELALADLGRQGLAPAGFEATHTIGAAMATADAVSLLKMGVVVAGAGLKKALTSAIGPTRAGTLIPGTGAYRDVGGHHLHQRAGFRGHAAYNPRQGFSISQDFMKSRGLRHETMTATQRRLFKELAESGAPNTLTEHTRIAVESLKAGGATDAEARALMSQSLRDLRGQGVRAPTRIPWFDKEK